MTLTLPGEEVTRRLERLGETLGPEETYQPPSHLDKRFRSQMREKWAFQEGFLRAFDGLFLVACSTNEEWRSDVRGYPESP